MGGMDECGRTTSKFRHHAPSAFEDLWYGWYIKYNSPDPSALNEYLEAKRWIDNYAAFQSSTGDHRTPEEIRMTCDRKVACFKKLYSAWMEVQPGPNLPVSVIPPPPMIGIATDTSSDTPTDTPTTT